MTIASKDIREKYLDFFAEKGHKKIDPAPLVLENDTTTLFTSSGMQPLVPYLMGEKHPLGKRLVNSQPSIRTVDIDEVGDNRHFTFFEMLGNWSLGDYFKEEQLNWIHEFFTRELGIEKDRLWVSVFEGSKQVPKDTQSAEVWKKIGIPEFRIFYYDAVKNWWSRTGTPEKMPVGEIGGPDSEIFYDFGSNLKIHENSPFSKKECHPNCDCGRFVEIGNSVFMQYKKAGDNKLEELPQKNVDFGGGFERIVSVVNGDFDCYRTDLFLPLIEEIEKNSKVEYKNNVKTFRIIADHVKAAVFLIKNGVIPGNKLQGYVLRRLLRRAATQAFFVDKEFTSKAFKSLVAPVVDSYEGFFKEGDVEAIGETIATEIGKFQTTIEKGVNLILKKDKIDAKTAFDLYQTHGFPPEITLEIAARENIQVEENVTSEIQKQLQIHREQSRTTSAGVFKGGLTDHSLEVVKLHTATHLLLFSLRKVLGDHVVQKGQNITKDRSRFDFPHQQKLTPDELKKVEDAINDIIKKNLPVAYNIMSKEQALKTKAIHAFNEKYADTVKVYFVGENIENAVSKEFCGGPHVKNTGEIGRVKISKQEKIGSGIMRIYLELE